MGRGSLVERVMRLVDQRRPDASAPRRAAAVNTIVKLMTGVTAGMGGPSVRERTAVKQLGGRTWELSNAVDAVLADDGPVFGPLTDLHRRVWAVEFCMDDDPEDIDQLDKAAPLLNEPT